jgi:hypothetical protein
VGQDFYERGAINMDMTKDKIEVGSEWKALVDEPWSAGVYLDEQVIVTDVDTKTGSLTFKDGRNELWSGSLGRWLENFAPVGQGLGYFDYPDNTLVKLSAVSDGGPAEYYDFPEGAITLNDLIEHKDMDFHRGNIFKACWRYGTKKGVSKEYDARKIIYSGARILMKLVGVVELRNTLIKMLDDPQFQDRPPMLE